MRPRHAFTLIEVLAALAILGVAATVLAGAYVNVLLARQALDAGAEDGELVELARAAAFATESAQDLRTGGEIPRPDGSNVRWTAEVEPTDLPDLVRVALEVELPRANEAEPRVLRQTFLVLRPTWTEERENGLLREDLEMRIVRQREFGP